MTRPARVVLLVAALGAASALPRLWRLSTPGLSSDEAFSWRLTGYPAGEMLRRAALDVHPPLYYLVLAGWRRALGDGPATLRALSVLLGLLAVPLLGVLVVEARRLDGDGLDPGLAAVAAAGALAIHATAVVQSRNARMYALGLVLAIASAWVLLRAARAGSKRAAWWTLWGLVAAAAVATHYYLVFTIAAEAAWAAGMTWGRRVEARPRDLALGVGAAFVIFAPWSAAFVRQATQVRGEYWIPPTTIGTMADGIARWALAADAGRLAPLVALGVVAALAACVRAGRAARFFALLAAAPWVLGLAASWTTGRPIVLERYMLFALPFLFAAVATAISGLARPALRVAAATVAIVVLAPGLLFTVSGYPADPPAMAAAARFLKRQAGEGDLIVVESPRALNKLRYYARQAGGERLDVRCALPERVPLSPHVSHVVSLVEGDAVPAGSEFASGHDTVWLARETTAPPPPAPAGWTITYARIFEGGDETRLAVGRYERAEAPR